MLQAKYFGTGGARNAVKNITRYDNKNNTTNISIRVQET